MTEIFEVIAFYIGAGLCLIGGMCLAVWLTWGLFQLICEMYISASYRFRGILQAESLIHEYREERTAYMEWKQERDT